MARGSTPARIAKALEGEVLPPNDASPKTVALDNRISRLRTAGDLRTEMGRVYRKAARGQMDFEEARSRIYMLDRMLSALKLERDIEAQETGRNIPFQGVTLVGPGGRKSK